MADFTPYARHADPLMLSMPPSLPDPRSLAHTFVLEQALQSQGLRVGGVDEAGRGPLAGPVVAACVVLDPEDDTTLYADSKVLSACRREELFDRLHASAAIIGVGQADAREIETINILQASLLAMRRAVLACAASRPSLQPDFLLVDGKFTVPLPLGQQALVKGESKSASIAAASIVAKVTRDRFMRQAHEQFPVYGFDRHQGYPTKMHREALHRHGPCELHRRTFRGVAELLSDQPGPPSPAQSALW